MHSFTCSLLFLDHVYVYSELDLHAAHGLAPREHSGTTDHGWKRVRALPITCGVCFLIHLLTHSLTHLYHSVEVLVSPTENIGKILSTFAEIQPSGAPDFAVSVSIAQLALRHRKNKNGGQRIIIFIGSPVTSDAKELKKMGSLLKKNNIAVDVVVMGEHEEVQEKMAELVNAANTNDNR
jgi:hypothetical protein